MPMYARLVITGLVATIALAALVTSASAGRLSTSGQQITATWFALELYEEAGGSSTIRCPVTLEGSFHSRTIAKVYPTLVGYITGAIAKHESCTGGGELLFYNGRERYGNNFPFANSLPWHVKYQAFTGTLPNIRDVSVLIEQIRFFVAILGTGCPFTGMVGNGSPWGRLIREGGGGITNFRLASGLIRAEAVCASREFSDRVEDGRIVVTGTTTRISVTLI